MPLVFRRTEQRAAMTAQPMRTVDVLQSSGSEFTARDDTVNGFRVRVRPTARPALQAVGKIPPNAPGRAKVISWLILFTGCRLREILHLRWEHACGRC